jgi:nitrate/nitrite transporter NarK
MEHRRSGRSSTNRAGRGLRLERLPRGLGEAIRLEYFRSHVDVYHQYLCAGLITGVAVGGFGAGALVTAPMATRLIQSVGVLQTFAHLGIAFLIVTVASGYFMQNPPKGWTPKGWTPTASQASQRSRRDYTLGEALRTWQWWALWLLLFLNTCVRISVISQEAPLFQELARVSAVTAASMVGIVSIGNAFGRVFWAWASDSITRHATFAGMFLGQAVLFWFLPSISSRCHPDAGQLCDPYVLWRRIRHDAGVCR